MHPYKDDKDDDAEWERTSCFKKGVDLECCKPDSVHPLPKQVIVRSFIYSTEAKFPSERDAAYPESLDGPPDSLFCLAPKWVYHAFVVTSEAVSSYLTFSPLPLDKLKAVYFLRH